MKRLLAGFAVLVFSTLATADDWPAWRGPTGQGYCFEKNVPMRWSATENVRWKVKLEHSGNSTPIVSKGRVFVTMANTYGMVRSLMCYDRTDGKLLWKNDVFYPQALPLTAAGIGHPASFMNPREINWTPDWYCNASPTSDGERVVVSHGSAGMYCYDFSGKELWKRTDLGRWQHSFGNAASPVFYHDLCILWCGPNGGKTGNQLLAVDKKTGKTVWETPEKASSWGTPIIVKIDDQDQLLYCPAYMLKSVDPKTGKENWTCTGLMEYVYNSPLYSPEHKIAVAMSGYQKSALAVKLTGKSKYTKDDLLWHHPRNDQRVGSGVIVGDHVYIYEENGGAFPEPTGPKCYELATGKEVWQLAKRLPSTNWGSMVHVDGKLYVFTRDCTTYIFNASPKFEVLATNKLDKGESTNSSPAISDGEIFLRTNRQLWCISEKK